ncbi:uncharacterized protein C10orf143 homolog [Mobula birostris]|uniref:uncharacterized protein C10orf143 homolog n=1 Tax=Mobula birostris TaxID=1983395 RepID=UPI003B281C96
MDYSVTLQKRRLAVPPESWGQPDKKRPCHGLDGGFQNDSDVPYTQLNWSSTDHQNLQNHVQPAEAICTIFALPSIDKLTSMGQPGTLNPCLRCLAGESGHINHITTG